jgi:type III pantothenate kinase
VAAHDLLAITGVSIRDGLVQEGAEDIRLVGALHNEASIHEEARGAVVLLVIHEGESLPQSGSPPHPRRPPYHCAVRYAVDLGNSAAKAALLDGAVMRLPAPADPRDAAAWAGVAAELIAAIRADAQRAGEPATLRVASVVPAGSEALKAAAANASIAAEFVHVDDVPLELALTPPAQIGIDRLLAAWLAYSEYGAPANRGAIAVTLGTALTLTCVDRSGRLLGGAIAPSPVLASRALASGAAALPLVAIYDESPELSGPIGANTAEALESGILRGARGALAALIAESMEEMSRRDPVAPVPAVVLSGGAALAGWCATIAADHRDAEYVLRAINALPAPVRA